MKYAYIEIANACNLNCSFCPYSQKTHSPSWMSVELFSKIIDDIKNHVEEIYLHVLGEPLLHPNLNIFLEIAKKAHLCVNITTNGTLIKKNHQLLLESTVVRQINFSVHALEEWSNQEKALSALNDMLLFAQEATERRPDLYINFRLWNIQKRILLIGIDSFLANWNPLFIVTFPHMIFLFVTKAFRFKIGFTSF